MEGSDELTLGTTSSTKDLANIVKGKRTKRQRPQSPIPFTITTHLSSGEGGTSGGGGGYGSNGDQNNNNNNNNSSSPQPASSDEFAISTTTEDEDTARLLILLARGHSRDYSSNYKNGINNNNNNNYNYDQDYSTSSFKFNSKRYIETSSTVNGKAGMYVYECKTCNRTFPSFQALGGHRASHKKPKNMAMAAAAAAAAASEEKKQQFSFAFSDDDEVSFKTNISTAPYHNITSNLINNNNNYKSSTTTAKIHECSYCGAEFTSGQALGGHMRRHRGANNNAAIATAAPVGVTNTALSLSPLSPLSVNQDSEEANKKLRNNGAGLSLSLDLNLPAPEDDHNKFSFTIKQQQQQNQQDQTTQQQQQQQSQQQKKEPTLMLSTTPTLVDCHY